MSLRARLLFGVVGIVIVGLVLADVVIYSQIHSYLATQIDQELLAIQPGTFSLTSTGTLEPNQEIPPGTYIELFLPQATGGSTFVGSNNAALHLHITNSTMSAIAAHVESATVSNMSILSANATGSGAAGGLYRVRAEAYSVQHIPAFALVALPLSSISGTMNTLLIVDLIVTAAVIAALIMLGYAVVRVGLRPLEDIEDLAAEIAAGDLSLRIEQDNPKTEVGRLGDSLNTMLGHIEGAFNRQQDSENQLRQFLADASHELRTPTTSIRGYAELFRRGAQNRPEDLALSMRRIEEESIRMGVLVDDLLLLARLDQGRALEMIPVALSELALDAAADTQAIAPERQISVDVEPEVEVIGDEQRLHQVVLNLLQNALKHTPAESSIELNVHHEDDDVVLSITDHGPGIALEHQQHIFERFYRADPSRTRESGGSGLGLAIVSSIVGAHHGMVSFTSVLGEGTTFVVRLPRDGTTSLGADLTPTGGDS
jgi:two-component system OmpR family sensor kinase